MRGYYIKVGSGELGPFTSESAAKAEAKELKAKGYTTKVVAREEPDTKFHDMFGVPEEELDIDDDDFDFDALFNDDADDNGDEGADDDGDEGPDDDADDDDDDEAPKGQHPWFRKR